MEVITVPGSLDHQTVDGFFDAVALTGSGRTLFDARHLRWVDPNGMVALLLTGTWIRDHQGALPRLQIPESADVVGYLGRMNFFEECDGVFDVE
ncbi:MAG: hypothetical protein P8170_20645, partial [Gemmatimonadota bacterium]